MIYPIVAYGDPVLKKRGSDLEKGDIDVMELAENMFETMHNAKGVGLAAPQIGKSLRMFVVDGTAIEGENCSDFKQVFINPVIKQETGEEWTYNEGCLSIPEIHEDVDRKPNLFITYFDENWKKHSEEYDGMTARIIQHEYDHIEGVLFTDHLSAIKKRLLKGKLVNISKGKGVGINYKMKFPVKK